MERKPAPKLYVDDAPIVPPPATAMVDFERKPALYTPDGKMLVRRVGF